jgi:hypothetical protein
MAKKQLSGIQLPTLSKINIDGELTLSTSAGTSGQVLTSQGTGATPIWTTVSGGGSGFTGAGTSITGITGTIVSGSATVTGTSITLSAGGANSTSNGADNITGGNLNIKSADVSATGNITGTVKSGNVNINVGYVNDLGTASALTPGDINIGTTYANNLYLDATNSTGSGSVYLGNNYAANVYVANSSNATNTTIHSGGTKNGNNLTLGSNISGSSVYQTTIYLGTNNATSTSVRIGTNTISLSHNLLFGKTFFQQPSPPTTIATARTLTYTDLLTFIVVTSATTGTLTLPTGTLMDTNIHNVYTDIAFQWSLINTGASGSVTMAAGTGHTYVGNTTVTFGTSARFSSRRTTTNTWITYRIS